MATPPDGIDKALEAAILALEPVVTADGVTRPRDAMEAVMQLARVVDALEELEYPAVKHSYTGSEGQIDFTLRCN